MATTKTDASSDIRDNNTGRPGPQPGGPQPGEPGGNPPALPGVATPVLPPQGPPVPDHMTQIEDQRKLDRQAGAELATPKVGEEVDYHAPDGKVHRMRVAALEPSGMFQLSGKIDGQQTTRKEVGQRRGGTGAGWMHVEPSSPTPGEDVDAKTTKR